MNLHWTTLKRGWHWQASNGMQIGRYKPISRVTHRFTLTTAQGDSLGTFPTVAAAKQAAEENAK